MEKKYRIVTLERGYDEGAYYWNGKDWGYGNECKGYTTKEEAKMDIAKHLKSAKCKRKDLFEAAWVEDFSYTEKSGNFWKDHLVFCSVKM